MYELYPYYTNDGTVGLFSRLDDDVYHSTYGALSESWQKFILPSNFARYINEHEHVKILDLCYGIGYNTKTALNVFINNALKNNKKIINKSNFVKKFSKENCHVESNICAIDTDNIFANDNNNSVEKKYENCYYNSSCSDEIYADNIINDENYKKLENSYNLSLSKEYSQKKCNKILIDAVDLDKTLMGLAPFIAEPSFIRSLFQKEYNLPNENKIKYEQIKNIKKFKKLIKKEYRLRKEVSIIILENLIEANPEFLNDKILRVILSHKKYTPFLSPYMINFAKFYQNMRYNLSSNANKMTYLHNIYYRYVSQSYKNAQELIKNNIINLNFYHEDARKFIVSTYNTYNFIFLDAFTPAKCPALWTIQFFRELYTKLEDDGLILTYSSSAAVRNAFLQNGFAVGKIYDTDSKKFVGTIAAKNKNLIEYELNEKDIDLINSRAGICFVDKNLDLRNEQILELRQKEVECSNLISSSKVLKGYDAKPI